MKKNRNLIVAFLCLLLSNIGFSQFTWTTVNSSRGNFSFQFPAASFTVDTLGLLTYINSAGNDSTIAFQVNFIDTVGVGGNEELSTYIYNRFGVNNPNRSTANPIDELEDPGGGGGGTGGNPCYADSIEAVLVTYAQMYSFTTMGTIEGFIPSDYTPCVIRGKELTIRHQEMSGTGSGFYFAFTRYFYWNGKFLSFTITGPESKIVELYAYKNQVFNSIIIN